MLNKEDIFTQLSKLNFPKDKYIVISGASMVVHGVKKETNDIDILINKDIEYLVKDWNFEFGINNWKIFKKDNIECFFDDFDKPEYDIINGIRFSTLEDVLKLKQKMNRKKDQKDIKALDLFLCLKDNKRYEKELYKKGISLIAGVDEVGRGPLIGPVVAACVILPKNFSLNGLTDSKKLSEKKREKFDLYIKENCLCYGIGVIDNDTIDKINIYEATKLAMYEAINKLSIKPECILIDAMRLELDVPSISIIKGDIKSITISAASVIAKVYRDNLLKELDKKHPEYNFKKNKGYPTKEHILSINKYGILKEHRKSYGPVAQYLKNNYK